MASKYFSHPRGKLVIDGKVFFYEDFTANLTITHGEVHPGAQATVDEFVPTKRMASWSISRAYRIGANTTPAGEGLMPNGRGTVTQQVTSLAAFNGKDIAVIDIVTDKTIAKLTGITTESTGLNLARAGVAQQPLSGRATNLLMEDEL
jgi:hypothetical protein